MRKKAFTLIELLVVLGVVIVLAVFVVFKTRDAIGSARSTASAANLRKLAAAGIAWSADNRGWVPPAAWYAHERGGTPGTMRLAQYGISAEDLICPRADPRLERQGMNIHYGINANLVMVGPSPGIQNASIDWSSYPWGPGAIYFWDHGNCKIMGIPDPASIVFFMDTGPFNWTDIESIGGHQAYMAMYNNNLGTPWARRHGGKAQIAWMDGRVSIEPDDFKYSIQHKGVGWLSGGGPDAKGKYFTH